MREQTTQGAGNRARKYGAKFMPGSVKGERLYDAVGMRAEVGVDDQLVTNDFDNVWPWGGMRRCNTVLIHGERMPLAFEGQDGYSSADKNVFVYVPLFFYYRNADDTECAVSTTKLPGFEAPKKFRRADGSYRDHVFLPAYTAGIKNGRAASKSGLEPFITNLSGWMELTKQLNGICIESTADDEIKNILLDVEFATHDPQSIMKGAVCADRVFPSGACDNVRASSGSPVSNTSGKYPCKWRGIENPWGNQFRLRWDVLVKDRVPYVIDSPEKYAGGIVTDDYKPLSYKISNEDGWANRMGFDSAFPYISLPVEVAESYEESSYGCYFWQWDKGTYALRVGGNVSNGRNAGARYCYLLDSPSPANWTIGASLSPA